MKNTLRISNLHTNIGQKEILRGISVTIRSGEVHAVMGPNGSGKSTLAYALMGHPGYEVKSQKSKIKINGKIITNLPAEDRAKAGLFLAFQSPIAVPGVSVVNLLRTAYEEVLSRQWSSKKRKENKESITKVQNPLLARHTAGGQSMVEFMKTLKAHAKALHIDETFLSRGIHDGFSGGEKKKMEMLQALTLAPKFAVFDEIDTGLDVDALKIAAHGIELLTKRGTGVIVITHYQRLLKYVKPDVVHVLVGGKIVKTGKAGLSKEIEEKGYGRYQSDYKTQNPNDKSSSKSKI